MTKYNKGEWNWDCMDCGQDTLGRVWIDPEATSEFYMLHYELWEKAVAELDRGRMLCIGCVETRLGRRLTKRDFHPGVDNDMGVNSLNWDACDPRSSRLIDRLTN